MLRSFVQPCLVLHQIGLFGGSKITLVAGVANALVFSFDVTFEIRLGVGAVFALITWKSECLRRFRNFRGRRIRHGIRINICIAIGIMFRVFMSLQKVHTGRSVFTLIARITNCFVLGGYVTLEIA